MPVFTIQAPDGRKIRIQANDQETALKGAQEWAAANPAQSMASAAPSDAPPAGAKPGSKEYADWALSRAKAGLSIPQVSPRPPEFGGTQDLVGAIQGGYTKALDSVPIIGPSLLAGAENAKAAMYGVDPALIRAETQANQVMNPEAAMTGAVAGTVLPLVAAGGTALGGRLLGMTGTVPQQIGMGALSGAALSAADTGARGGSMEDVIASGALGGVLGGAVPAVGAKVADAFRGMAQNKAITQAIADAPAADELKTAASALFQNSKAANAGVSAPKFQQFAVNLAQKAASADIDPTLDGQAVDALRKMLQMAQESGQTGGITFAKLHNLRQIAQDVVIEAKKNRTKQFANEIVDGLDNLISTLKPADMYGANAGQAGNQLLEGISTWSRAKKVGLIEEAIYKAQNVASGFENGIRIEFRKLLQNPKIRKQFSATEIAEIERVVRGTPGANLLKLIGKFGFGSGNSSNMLGGTIGTTIGGSLGGAFGPVGTIAGAALAGGGASLARQGAEKLTEKAAERAAKVIATPNVPTLPQIPYQGYIPPALLPLLAN